MPHELDKAIDEALQRAVDVWNKDPLNAVKERIVLGQSAAAHVALLEDEHLAWVEEEARAPKYYQG